jgi:hypothetical protein
VRRCKNRHYHRQIILTCRFAPPPPPASLVAALYDGNQADASLWLGVTIETGRVVGLAWYEEDLAGDIPEELGYLSALQHLDLSDNALTGSLPASFGQLKNLSGLSLSNNQLSGDLPEELFELTALTTLRLNSNHFMGEGERLQGAKRRAGNVLIPILLRLR